MFVKALPFNAAAKEPAQCKQVGRPRSQLAPVLTAHQSKRFSQATHGLFVCVCPHLDFRAVGALYDTCRDEIKV